MRGRRRVSLRESFKIAGKAAFQGEGSSPYGEIVSLMATVAFGIWCWIAGVPTGEEGQGKA
jgi:hypothetical protein